MKAFQTALFVLAIVIAGTQTMRHVYVKWIAPEGSVLDQFNTEVQSEIAAADTLDELVPLYADATARVEEFEADPVNRDMEPYLRNGAEPYLSQVQLRQAIQQRERLNARLRQLLFYATAGIVVVAMGMVVFTRVNQWLGMASVLTGFSELLWWTSPLTGPALGGEFEILLDFKLFFSALTAVGLVAIWLLAERGLVLSSQRAGPD